MPSDVRGPSRRQTLARALFMGLVPLPLVLIIGGALYSNSPHSQQSLPLLPANQARALASYGLPCLRPEECEPPLGCFEIGDTGRGICLNTECETDAQCEPGEYCRTLRTMGTSPPLRVCDKRGGERLEGEPCSPFLTYDPELCAQGLLCNRGWCGRPCRLEDSSTCPEGFFCQQGLDGPSCVPTCEARGCPEGLQCARESGGISVCVQLRGSDCSDGSCSAGSSCTFTNLRVVDAGLALRQECIAPCGEGKPPCPSDRVCVANRCLRTCAPLGPTTCYSEERCVYRDDLAVALCKQVR